VSDQTYSFGAWVRLRRQALVLTREELAGRVGCAEVTIRKIEADERKPSPQVAELLAQYLGLADDQREMFVRAARGMIPVGQLPPAIPGAPVASASHRQSATSHIQRSTVPRPSTPLVGREREVIDVARLLQQTDVRLVTLTGPGGIGKTRLALTIATVVQHFFRDGVVFVNLAPVSDASLVIPTIAQALAVREVAGQSLMACLTAFLDDQQCLLILDNVAQVVASAAQIGELLTSSAGMKILVTSRTILNLQGEHDYRVPLLTLPDPHSASDLTVVAQSAAVTLFLQRARAARSTFMLTVANTPIVIAICTQLDGLPLALELAAARTKVLSLAALRDRLHDRFATLTGGARDLPARQQTLRSTIAWSYDLLDPRHQRLFARLAIFADGCTLHAATAICWGADQPHGDALDALTVLVNTSMLQTVQDGEREPRFVMLETLQAYALEQLEATGETARMARQHARYYLVLAEASAPEVRGPPQDWWLQQLETERDNLRVALAWALNGGDTELGVRLAIALWQFWEQGYGNEGRTWLNRAASGSSGVAHTLRARVLLRGGWYGAGDQATTMVEESLALFRELGDRSNTAWALTKLGHHAWLRSEYAQAITFLEESLTIFRDLGDSRGMASTLHLLGDATRDCGQNQQALRCFEESIARFHEVGDQSAQAMALNGLGDVFYNLDDLVQAQRCYQESVALFQQSGNQYGLPWALMTLGRVTAAQGQYPQAQRLLEDSVARFRSLGHQSGLAWSLHHLSTTLILQNAEREAYGLLREALELQRRERNRRLIVASLERCAILLVRRQALILAARIGGAAEALHQSEHIPFAPVDHALYAHETAALTTRMGESALAEAWAAGRALTWEQAADAALAWLNEAQGATP